ncbi:class I SAM-dependent methyltransferase [Bacillus sp. ISL-39]|uniref:class I SAM-dependent DNA methyltransferase n=1 Tax=Bacillus sp. ISL-39 TaxID=2819124 RepID=UPI001BE9C2E2|nr:class I SAM-dependent methyltransferase [Bacillus sp. ISL-39]MBT2636925.1 methyltransferase domain-containing protein [Bacillus sp. ISL-39]
MGREFIPLFDDWAEYYEDTVSGLDREYKEVFENYDKILETVAIKSNSTVLEFGVGTGNLTEKLISLGRVVYGIEPSKVMREKTKARFTDLQLFDGDFINFPEMPGKVDTIVSTYAFHHLTDEEKDTALKLYSNLLGEQGKIVFADTAFVNEEDREERHRIVKEQGHENLLADLKREYYTTLEALERLFEKNGFQVSFEKMNSYVWLMEAVKVSKN